MKEVERMSTFSRFFEATNRWIRVKTSRSTALALHNTARFLNEQPEHFWEFLKQKFQVTLDEGGRIDIPPRTLEIMGELEPTELAPVFGTILKVNPGWSDVLAGVAIRIFEGSDSKLTELVGGIPDFAGLVIGSTFSRSLKRREDKLDPQSLLVAS